MRITKISSVVTIILLASQLICGIYLMNNPEAAAAGSANFHMKLGIATLIATVVTIISLFRAAKKTV